MRRAFLILGIVLLLTAAGLAVCQLHCDRVTAQRTQQLLQQAKPIAAAPLQAQPQEETPTLAILELPSLDLALPVQAHCSAENLKLSPCRYAGSAATEDLVVAGHNYAAHFGALHRLQVGDAVGFTDLDGAAYRYRVTAVEVLPATAVGELTQSGADLTLFTCTAGGKNRIAVRCEGTE